MKQINKLIKLLEKYAGEVVQLRPPKQFDNIEEFEAHVRKSPLDQRKTDLIESIMQTVALESESMYLDLDEQAFIDLQNYLRNWIQEWAS